MMRQSEEDVHAPCSEIDEQPLKDQDRQSSSNDKLMEMHSRSVDRHKVMECKVCLRKMRSNTLQRHMKTHQTLFTVGEDEVRKEIKQIKQLHENRTEREQFIRQVAGEEGILPEKCGINGT